MRNLFGEYRAADFIDVCRRFIRAEKPPEELLHVGLHGSSTEDAPRKHSDVDFYFICRQPTLAVIQYIPRAMDAVNRETGLWADPMVGSLENSLGGFSLNPFTVGSIRRRHVNIYGKGLSASLRQMEKNHVGETSEEYLYTEVRSAGIKVKKGLFIMNDRQHTHSCQVFGLECLRVENPAEVKATFLAKQILTAAAFANCLQGCLTRDVGLAGEFSKRKAPEIFVRTFGLETPVPSLARDIYYNDNTAGIEDLLGRGALSWLETQAVLEKRLYPAVEKITMERLAAMNNS